MHMNKIIDSFKKHPDFPKMGMIASHLGVVRATSLNGRQVTAVDVSFDQNRLSQIIDEIKKMPGIVEVRVQTFEGRLKVGDEIMAVFVGGDTREHVFPALVEAVDLIKRTGTRKKELFADGHD